MDRVKLAQLDEAILEDKRRAESGAAIIIKHKQEREENEILKITNKKGKKRRKANKLDSLKFAWDSEEKRTLLKYAVKLALGGMTYEEIGSKLGYAQPTITGWFARMRKEGIYDRYVSEFELGMKKLDNPEYGKSSKHKEKRRDEEDRVDKTDYVKDGDIAASIAESVDFEEIVEALEVGGTMSNKDGLTIAGEDFVKRRDDLEEISAIEQAANVQISPAEKYKAYMAGNIVKKMTDAFKDLPAPRTWKEMEIADKIVSKHLGLDKEGGGSGAGALKIDISVLARQGRTKAFTVEAVLGEEEAKEKE